jgi:xanthine dehydrogenase accessory factor
LGETNAGRAAALCAVVATRGSTPQPPGAMLCVDGDAQITGTLGGGCVEAEVRRRAHELLIAGRSAVLTFELDHDFGYDDGMICGGQMDVAVSVYSPSSELGSLQAAHAQLVAGEPAVLPIRVPTANGLSEYRVHLEAMPELLIAGGGHISRILAPWMASLGFRVSVLDDRAEYANAKRFPSPIRLVAADIAGLLKNWAIGPNTYVVIVTRGHKHDEAALQAVLGSRAKYIGMIGSRRKVRVIVDDLLHRGATREQLDRVHAPIGLDIGAVTAEEIALSIAAQLVSIRRAERCRAVEGPLTVPGATP